MFVWNFFHGWASDFKNVIVTVTFDYETVAIVQTFLKILGISLEYMAMD
jgi:hypothetical protein